MKTEYLKAEYVEFIPDDKDLKEGVIYVSRKYRTATHLCPCGCNSKIVTPLKDGFWKFHIDAITNDITLYPSIGNFDLKCRSHYFIRDSRIVWCETAKESTDTRRNDNER